MSNCGKNQYFADLIGSDYQKWATNDRIILDGGTGTGKTYFILNVFARFLQANGKRCMYLCNRSALKEQVQATVNELELNNTVTVSTYQKVQAILNKSSKICLSDVIVADECHFITADADFNDYTDYIHFHLRKHAGMVIYISATASNYFQKMQEFNWVRPENYYYIPKDYSYVDSLTFYDQNELTNIISEIWQKEADSKIIVFCNSLDRMIKLHDMYGNNANYYAAKNAKSVSHFCTDCIQKYDDNTITFEKQLLITTKVLDNGIDLKDSKIKHIFSEIFDVDCCIQALGRKRPISADDHCQFYLKNYTDKALNCFYYQYHYQLQNIDLYKNNYERFYFLFAKDRKFFKQNPTFYPIPNKDKDSKKLMTIGLNSMKEMKLQINMQSVKQMKESSYSSYLCTFFPTVIEINLIKKKNQINNDKLLQYFQKIENKKLYSTEKENIKKTLKNAGYVLRSMGINTVNGILQDQFPNYKPRFHDKDSAEKKLKDRRRTLDNGEPNPNRDKSYWLLY